MFTGIQNWTGYSVWEDERTKSEQTHWHRPTFEKFQACANITYRNGKVQSARLSVKPDGYWADVITVNVDSVLKVRINHGSGGTASEDKDSDTLSPTVGVECDIQRTMNFIDGLKYAAQFAALYRMKFEEEARNA